MKMFWRLKTAAMFVFMTGLLVAIGAVIGYFVGDVWLGFLLMLGLSVAMNLYAYFGSKKAALAANNVTLIQREDCPELYEVVERLATKAGLPMPEVGISEVPMPNAFATGRNPKNAAVVATRPLLDLLTEEELEGVMAHEMSHVKNRDILVMSVASTLASMISFLARIGVYSALASSGNKNGGGIIIMLLMEITLPIAAMMVQLGVSRSREYLADESGGRLTGNPMALADALMKLERGCAAPTNTYDRDSYASMWISNPISGKSFASNLFRTHPSTAERIERLRKLDMELRGFR